MSDQHAIQWVRPPLQSRSQETLDRLLDAAEAVLAEKGFDQATVAEIASRAQSSVGAFYARFHDKESLLRLLHDRFCAEAMATADAALDPHRWAGATVSEILHDLVPFLVRIYDERRGLMRAFIVRSGHDESFLEAGAKLGLHIAERLERLLLECRREITHPDPALAVRFGLRLAMHYLDQSAIFAGVPQFVQLDVEQLSAELCRAYLSYLGIEPPHRRINGHHRIAVGASP
ncbi:MAG: TetR/AcrR family transcriptional regulator [Pirellulales bacterium]|nr:TetR/AcrR family transcriptional regulator [Pirellulales bacterium]